MTPIRTFPCLLAIALFSAGACAAAPESPPIRPDGPVINLERSGAFTLGYQLRNRAETLFAVGRESLDDPASGVSFRTDVHYDGRNASFMQPPSRRGAGVTFQAVRVQLPRETAATLRGSMRIADGADCTDGVTYRVHIDGRRAFERHVNSKSWQDFTVDLSSVAGRTVALRFEVDPGPRDHAGCDWAWWGGRRIDLPGYSAPALDWKSPPPIDLLRLGSAQNLGWAPRSGFDGRLSARIDGDIAVLSYDGADGVMEFHWNRPDKADDPPFGHWMLRARMKGDRSVEMPLLRGSVVVWTQPTEPVGSNWQQRGNRIVLNRTYRLRDGSVATLTAEARLAGKSLVIETRCDRPVISQLQIGQWGPPARRRPVPAPYYEHAVHYLPDVNLFVSRYLDFSDSRAARYGADYAQALYEPRTDGSRHLLGERMIYTAAWHPVEVMANLPNPASPWRSELGKRIVLDVWGGKFDDIAKHFSTLADHGMTGILALVHIWQRHGYDNGLPTHLPANEKLGGPEAMKRLTAAARDAGFLVGMHENYLDYYPNYERFNEVHVALNSRGERIKAWFNFNTGIQSYAARPAAMLDLARAHSPLIHEAYGTNAAFHDVVSSAPPWFQVDYRAPGRDGSGDDGASMQQTIRAYRELFADARRIHKGPVLGEGNRHWHLSGYLDGVAAQFGTGWPSGQGMAAPLAVDFALLRIHPLQLNHGQGYFRRWWSEGPWGGALPRVLLDQYRMQEIAFGNAGYLGDNWRLLPDAWLEYHLTRPVTKRNATAAVTGIAYQVGGRWVDTAAAARAGNYRRVRVTYDNGLTITANDADAPLDVDGITLPRFGWVARAGDFVAYTAQRDGVVVDYARTPSTIFANARPAAEWLQEKPPLPITPSVASFEQIAPRRFRVTYLWQAGKPPDGDLMAFVRFCESLGYIKRPGRVVFQKDHVPVFPQDGPHEIILPDGMKDGAYYWETGLMRREGGREPLPIDGFHDGGNSMRLGRLIVRGAGKSLTFEPAPDLPPRSAWYLRHINLESRAVDFGPVRTDASVYLERDGSQWTLRPFPRDRTFTVQFRKSELPMPAKVFTGAGAESSPSADGEWWTFPLSGAKAYRWTSP